MKKIQFNINKKRRKYAICFLSGVMLLLVFSSCKKQLDVKNPNDPTFDVNVTSEDGITAYGKGVVYWNGLNYSDGWLGDSYFSLPWGYHELMGDVVGGGQGSNNQTTTMGVPDKFQADPNDPSTVFVNPAPQATAIIRGFNNTGSTAAGNNALYYEWVNMYSMINGCNLTLEHVGNVPLSTDKANTIKAWAYWWKGMTTLNDISNQGDYSTIIAKLIPAQNQVGLGLPLSSAQWIRTINTMLARNILLNHLAPFVNGNSNATLSKSTIPAMTDADWQSVITYCNNGIQQGDYVFTGRTSESNSFFTATGGSVAGICTESNQVTTYKVSERIVQQFKAGDKRLANFDASNGTFYGDANTNTTRYSLIDIPILGSREVGGLEIYIGPTYEENELMLAEAKIRTGDVPGGLSGINNVRSYQGAGVAALSGLTADQALAELTMERLAALAFRGLSFYDTRRWGWTYSIANGGGRYGCTLIFNATVYTNATIDYNFMDYWDVPADETDKNPPSEDSVPVKNQNY